MISHQVQAKRKARKRRQACIFDCLFFSRERCHHASSIQKWIHEKATKMTTASLHMSRDRQHARDACAPKIQFNTSIDRQDKQRHILRSKVRTTNDPYQKSYISSTQAIHYTTQEQTRPVSQNQSALVSQTTPKQEKKKRNSKWNREYNSRTTLCNKYKVFN
jgi:hypothetical protein